MRPPNGRRPPSRHRPAPAPAVSSTPLGEIAHEFEAWRKAQPGKPSHGAQRHYWRPLDAKHGPRPDYLLWRHLHCPDALPEKRQDIAELATKALKAREAHVVLPAILLVTGWLLEGKAGAAEPKVRSLLQETLPRFDKSLKADPSGELVRWLAQSLVRPDHAALLTDLSVLFTSLDPAWKQGRAVALPQADWLPVLPRVIIRWLVTALRSLTKDAKWLHTAWRLMRSLRPDGALIRPAEWELLMAAASAARIAGHHPEALRLTALALPLLPDRSPEPLRQRARVAAWFLTESGIEAPASLRVNLDDLPFPGDAPTTDKGQEATRLFRDEADLFQTHLLSEVEADADWQKLRAAGIALHHPLAALAWVGKRAQSYALKKQHDLLQAAVRLALKHHSLGTLARIRAEYPESAAAVLELNRTLRESQRRLPVLRDWAEWRRTTDCLRTAWGRLENDALQDEEALFFLHETLLDREATLLRCLPEDLRALAAEHTSSPRRPSALVQALDAEPKLFQSLEHQRAVELWSIASELRERPEMAEAAWISLVLKGEAASGKYSWILQSAMGRKSAQGRVRTTEEFQGLANELVALAKSFAPELKRVYLATDHPNLTWPPEIEVKRIPSWEHAFREMRGK
ncbi:hypothetical protein [Brevifollis gellanilyticus]|uniref:Uncharacterized protein n=1 Tax=Brevifollis gellanilyticus TaxID=748831 RepID=A0A512M264_9BACT|nr:hypothetical protein [Brevifollis gellanilyticus]GEP40834.1 hypothetical protein BGE01nite_01250 [Brevifollis gellanilyticus]